MGETTHTLLSAFQSLGIALSVGLLVGLERGWAQRDARAGERVAGFRTFGILGLGGGIAGLLAVTTHAIVLAFALAGIAAILIAAHLASTPRTQDYGITSEVAAFLTFSLGAAAATGYGAPAAAAAVVLAALLGYKPELHDWIERLDRDELIAALQLALISVVVLPMLPDRGYGPWAALNPYRLWWLVVLIAGIAFVGHFAVRVLGERRGILLTGVFGGLASSTALTLSFARMGRDGVAHHGVLAVGVILATGTVFPRMIVEVGVVNRDFIAAASGPLAVMAVVGYAAAALVWPLAHRASFRGSARVAGKAFQLSVALQFAVLLAAISVLSEASRAWLGDTGVYALALVSGVADVDAITLSLARMAGGSLAPEVARNGLVIAAITNTLVKAGMVAVIAGGRMALWVGTVAVVTSAAGGLSLLWF